MEWADEGIVLGVRRHGESSAIVELLTRGHGRHLGLVRGGAGKRMRPMLQPGNSVRAVWRARLDEHLGYYAIEGTRLRAATVLASSHAVYGVTHLASLARLLPERDPHEDIYELLERTLDDFDDIGEAAIHLVKFELAMLAELGFGLDLENCAATGATTELIYVAPAIPGATGCCGCRRSCAKQAAAPTAGRIRTCRTAFGLPACSCCATCWNRAGRAIPTPATGLSTR
jgi:DNA repair protein RecO (recombination protein O)